MSYCRWSSDDFRCDIYAYPTDDGVTVVLTKNRYDFTPPPRLPENATRFRRLERRQAIHALLEDAPLIPIDLPYAGEWRDRITHEEAAEWLTELRELGYNFPVDVIDAIKEDMHD